MGVLFVAFVLVCGFIFTNFHLRSRYRQKRSSGWEAYFHVAAWGFVFIIIGLVTTVAVDFFDLPSKFLSYFDSSVLSLNQAFKNYSADVFTPREAAVAGFSLVSSLAIGTLSFLRSRGTDVRIRQLAEVCKSDEVELLLLESSTLDILVSITLQSRKCYVGRVFKLHADQRQTENVAIIPMLSGYRDKDDLELHITRNYFEYYRQNGIFSGDHKFLTLSSFRVVIPLSEVCHASLFDIETYVRFNATPHQRESDANVG